MKMEMEFMNISELKVWEKNPKLIRDEKYKNLLNTIKTEGLDLPLLIDTRKDNFGVIISGNMRYQVLKELGIENIWVRKKETRDDAHFFQLAIQHNMAYGEYVPEQVAELADLYKDLIRLEELDVHLARPLDLDFHLQSFSPNNETQQDVDTTDDKLDTYLNNNIKQIVLYFENTEYEEVVSKLQAISEGQGYENNTQAFLYLLKFYEEHKND